MGISQNAMARAIGVLPRAINEIVLGRRAITPPMSIRFGAFFGQSPEFWKSGFARSASSALLSNSILARREEISQPG